MDSINNKGIKSGFGEQARRQGRMAERINLQIRVIKHDIFQLA